MYNELHDKSTSILIELEAELEAQIEEEEKAEALPADKVERALEVYGRAIKAEREEKKAHGFTIKPGNRKTSAPSFDTPPIYTCAGSCSGCRNRCYALKYAERYKKAPRAEVYNFVKFYKLGAGNKAALELAHFLIDYIKNNNVHYFRAHEAGDLMNIYELLAWHITARECPGCSILLYTKRADVLQRYAEETRRPDNLHIYCSRWIAGAEEEHHDPDPLLESFYPSAYTIDKHAEAPAYCFECPGNCEKCGRYCWHSGEGVYFRLH